jgi:hypothetical protein
MPVTFAESSHELAPGDIIIRENLLPKIQDIILPKEKNVVKIICKSEIDTVNPSILQYNFFIKNENNIIEDSPLSFDDIKKNYVIITKFNENKNFFSTHENNQQLKEYLKKYPNSLFIKIDPTNNVDVNYAEVKKKTANKNKYHIQWDSKFENDDFVFNFSDYKYISQTEIVEGIKKKSNKKKKRKSNKKKKRKSIKRKSIKRKKRKSQNK